MDKPDYVRAWERATGTKVGRPYMRLFAGEVTLTDDQSGSIGHSPVWHAYENGWGEEVPALESPEWLADVLAGLLRQDYAVEFLGNEVTIARGDGFGKPTSCSNPALSAALMAAVLAIPEGHNA